MMINKKLASPFCGVSFFTLMLAYLKLFMYNALGGIVMLSKDDLIKQLSVFKTDGRPVTVHTSLKAIGEIEGGAETLLSVLIEYFTADGGLLVIPTHTWGDRILDLNKAESCIGVLPRIAAAHEDGIRSEHPSHSVMVFGDKEKAKSFIKGDAVAVTPTNPIGSYGMLCEEEGYVLLIGVGQEKNTYIHCVEEMLKYPRYMKDKVSAKVIHKNGAEEVRSLYWFDTSKIIDVSQNFGKFEEAFKYHNCIQYGTLGNARVQLCKAKNMKNVIDLIYKNANGKELLADNTPLEEKLYK